MGLWDQNMPWWYSPGTYAAGKAIEVGGQAAEKLFGRKLVPEFGVSEALAYGVTPTPTTPTQAPAPQPQPAGQVLPATTYTQPTYQPPAPQPQPVGGPGYAGFEGQTVAAPEGGSYRWSGGQWTYQAPSGGPTGPSAEDIAAVERREQELRASIEAQYEPVFSELDRRLGLLPEEKTGLEKQVSDIFSYLRGEIEARAEEPRATIQKAYGVEKERAAQTLRELAETGRGFLRAAAGQFGGTSGVPAVTMGMTKAVTRERGGVLRQRDELLATLDQKLIDVDREVTQEKSKVDLWKSNQLTDIGEEIRRRRDEIEAQKVGASTEKIANLTALEMQIFQTAQQRLLDLDRQVRDYNAALDAYRAERGVDLENYAKQLQLAATYSPTDYNWDLSKLSPSQMQALATGGGQPVSYGGYTFEPEGEDRRIIKDAWGNQYYVNPDGSTEPVPGMPKFGPGV